MPTIYKSKGLEIILAAKSRCLYVGAETEGKTFNPKIRRYLSKGCERLVIYENNKPVSGFQIMIRVFDSIGVNVYTMPSKRQKGYARQLWEEAKKHHPILHLSTNRSEDGKIFADHCK